MRCDSFWELYEKAGRPLVIAHGTNIGHAPANSLAGVKSAYDMGCDFVEFDLRVSKEKIPVLCHNPNYKATANVDRFVHDMTLAELKQLNISHWQYFPDASGRTLPYPLEENAPVASFQEVLEGFHDRIFMNIQVYERDQKGIENICGLYREFNMYERAFMTMDNFEEAARVRAVDPEIPLCVLNRPVTMAALHDLYDFGCRIAQPVLANVTPEYCETGRRLGIRSNVYYANYERQVRHVIECGVDGILTDYPENVLPLLGKSAAV